MSVKRLLRLIRQWGVLVLGHSYDLRRYFRAAASTARPLRDSQLRARLLQKAHSVEKGLAMPQVRAGFGAAAVSELVSLVAIYERRGLDRGHAAYRMARHAAGDYCRWHDDAGLPIPALLEPVRDLAAKEPPCGAGGVERVSGAATKQAARGDFEALVKARRSMRMFGPGEVDAALIESAVKLAQRSPSVCNRQSARARHITRQPLLDDVLVLQGGNRGFTETIPSICLVTVDLSGFRGSRERNQAWIDGGMFAMSLLYALTYLGLGTCPLNWSSDPRQDQRLRVLADLPDNEVVIMLIAVGQLPEDYRVATSPRLALDEVLLTA